MFGCRVLQVDIPAEVILIHLYRLELRFSQCEDSYDNIHYSNYYFKQSPGSISQSIGGNHRTLNLLYQQVSEKNLTTRAKCCLPFSCPFHK